MRGKNGWYFMIPLGIFWKAPQTKNCKIDMFFDYSNSFPIGFDTNEREPRYYVLYCILNTWLSQWLTFKPLRIW